MGRASFCETHQEAQAIDGFLYVPKNPTLHPIPVTLA